MNLIENVKILQGHEGAVYKIVYDSSKEKLYSVGGEGWLVEWDIAHSDHGVLIARVPDQVFALSVSPEYFLLGSFQGNFYVLNRQEGKIEFQEKVHKGGIFDIHWDAHYFYTFGGDGRLILWDKENFEKVKIVEISNKSLRAFAVDETKGEIAVGSSDSSIYILSYPDLFLRKQIEGAHDPSVFALLYSEGRLISGGRDARIRIWNPDDLFSLEAVLDAHWYAVYDLIQTPSFVVSSSRDKTIRWWERTAMSPLTTVKWGQVDNAHVHSVNSLAYDSKNDLIFSGGDDRTIRIWKMKEK